MKVHSQVPGSPLRGVVSRFLVVESPEERSDMHLPETGFIAAFRLSGECQVGDRRFASPAILTGLTDHLRRHQHGRNNTTLVVHFTPLGASAFTHEALDGLWNASVDLGNVIGSAAEVSEVVERLLEAPDPTQRIEIVERFLLARLDRHKPDPLVSAAIDWMAEHVPAPARVRDLVRHIGLSQSALERRFRRVVGAAPKRFLSLLRLKRAAQLLQSGTSLTTVAHAAGYCDQAHFNHEFRRMAGLTPGEYFTQARA